MERPPILQERTKEEKLELYGKLMRSALEGANIDMREVHPCDVGSEGRQAIATVVRRGGKSNRDSI